MKVNVRSVEDHRVGSFYVDVRVEGKGFKRFSSMVEAMGFVRHERDRAGHSEANINLKEIVLMPMKEMVYETAYCM